MTTNLVFVVVESTLDYYFDLFIQAKEVTVRPRTIRWYTQSYQTWRAATAHQSPDWPPTAAHGLAFLAMFNERNLADYTRSNYYRGVSVLFNWLVKNGFLDRNPLNGFGKIKAPRPLPKAPDEEDVAQLLKIVNQVIRDQQGRATQSWQTVRDLAMFSVALDTGARLNELVAMRLADVQLKRQQQVQVFSWKDREGRTLTLGDKTTADLACWIEQRAKLNPPKSLTALWLSDYQHKGLRALTDSGISQRLRFWLKKADVSHFGMNNFRHAFAVFSLRNGADLIDIKAQMGHASIKTTAIYTEVVNKGRAERHRKTSPRENLPFDT